MRAALWSLEFELHHPLASFLNETIWACDPAGVASLAVPCTGRMLASSYELILRVFCF